MNDKWPWARIIWILIAITVTGRTDANDGEVHIGVKLLDNDSNDSELKNSASQHSSGSFSTFKHIASSSASGGDIVVARSANWGQPRAHASKILELTPRKSIDNMAPSRAVVHNDLHYAFRLPLQRLSDRQLTILLERYQLRHKSADKLDYRTMPKAEKLKRLQKLITTSSGANGGRLQLIRPTLLTNINVINEDNPNSFKIKQDNESIDIPTTPPPSVEKIEQKLDGFDTKNELSSLLGDRLSFDNENVGETSEGVDRLTRLLNEFRARYEKIKEVFQKKLEELNERRKAIMTKLQGETTQSQITTVSSDPTGSTTEIATVSENFTTEKIKTDDASINDTGNVDDLNFNPSLMDSSVEKDSERKTYPSELITVKLASKPTTIISTTTEETTTVSQTITVESITMPTPTANKQAITITTAVANASTLTTETNQIEENPIQSTTTDSTEIPQIVETTTESLDPFSPQISNIPKIKESKLLKKILGLIQFVKNNRTRPTALLSTRGGTFSTSQILAANNDDENNDNDAVPRGEMIEAPRAEAVQPLYAAKKVQLISNDDKENERNENPAKKTNNKADAISTVELMEKLEVENEQLNRRKELEKQDRPTAGNIDIISKNNDRAAVCAAIDCDFEQGNLCSWMASEDTVQPGDSQYRSRVVRETIDHASKYVQRTWHNWEGRYRNRLTGIARAEVFSAVNRRFAAAYTKPRQYATLTAEIPSGGEYLIKFRAWEATRDLRLRLCCESLGEKNCVFETERGVRRGSRHWIEHQATCPTGTTKIIFECLNDGIYQGACGLDNIQLQNIECPLATVTNGMVENRR